MFFVNVPLGFFAVMCFLFVLSKNKEAVKPLNINWLEMIGVGTCLTFLLLALNAAGDVHALLNWRYSAMVALFALLVFICLLNRKSCNHLVEKELFYEKGFTASVSIYLFLQICFSSVLVLSSVIFQKNIGLSSFEAGLFFLFLTVTFSILSPFCGKLIDRYKLLRPLLFGFLLLAICFLFMSHFAVSGSYVSLASLFCLMGLCFGLLFPGMNTWMMQSLSPDKVGLGSSIFSMSGLIGSSIGTTISITVFSLFSQYLSFLFYVFMYLCY